MSNQIKEQNILFYTEKTTEYLGLLRTFKLLLNNNIELKDVNELANNTLASSILLRNHLVCFMENLFFQVQHKKISSPEHVGQILQFIQQMMELLPVGMHLEFILSHRLDQKEFSQVLIEECHTQYSNLQLNYRGYLNEINNGLREYRIKNTEVSFFEQIKIPAKQLLESSLYSELLEKPAMEKLSYSR